VAQPSLGYIFPIILEAQAQPISPRDHRAAQGDEDDHQDKSTTTADAGRSPPKAEPILHPIEDFVEDKEF